MTPYREMPEQPQQLYRAWTPHHNDCGTGATEWRRDPDRNTWRRWSRSGTFLTATGPKSGGHVYGPGLTWARLLAECDRVWIEYPTPQEIDDYYAEESA